MTKKLVLGLAVCGYVMMAAMGMDNIGRLVSDVAKDPANDTKLAELVAELVDQERGFDNSLEASECIICAQVALKNKDDFSRVCCMIDAILGDWIRNDCANSLMYYLDGEKTGKFGPFVL